MKRFISLFIFSFFIIVFIFNLIEYNNNEYDNLLNSTNSFNYKFIIPDDAINLNIEHMEVLKSLAKKNNVNIARSISYYDNNKDISIHEEYVFLSTDSSLYSNIDIKFGRELLYKDMLNKDLFISTNNTNNENQIGIISDFGSNHYYSIYVIDRVLDNYKYPGIYKLEAKSKNNYYNFLNDYVNYINDYIKDFSYKNKQEFKIEDGFKIDNYLIDKSTDNFNGQENITIKNSNKNIFQLISFIIILLSLIYYLFYNSKEISVLKLNGYSTYHISYKIFIESFNIISLLSFLIILIAMFFVKDNNFEFYKKVIFDIFLNYVLLLIILFLISLIYIKKINITYSVKGQNSTLLIFIINSAIKVVISIVILITLTNIWTNLNLLKLKEKNLANWEIVSDYAVFYPIKVGDDKDSITAGNYPLDLPTYELYPYLNKNMESIYINSFQYTQNILNAEKDKKDIIKTIKINPNYLKKFPVYDENSNLISIDENIEESIFLIPEQYKDKEEYNLNYFLNERKRFHDNLHVDYYNYAPKENSKKVKFIYTKKNQDIFSINPNVFPNNNNLIKDPIIQVLTEANSLVPDRTYTSLSNQTLFIKLVDSNVLDTYSKIFPHLEKHKLNDNLPSLVKHNELIMNELNFLKESINIILLVFFISTILLIIILFQNIYLHFETNKYEFFLKKFLDIII